MDDIPSFEDLLDDIIFGQDYHRHENGDGSEINNLFAQNCVSESEDEEYEDDSCTKPLLDKTQKQLFGNAMESSDMTNIDISWYNDVDITAHRTSAAKRMCNREDPFACLPPSVRGRGAYRGGLIGYNDMPDYKSTLPSDADASGLTLGHSRYSPLRLLAGLNASANAYFNQLSEQEREYCKIRRASITVKYLTSMDMLCYLCLLFNLVIHNFAISFYLSVSVFALSVLLVLCVLPSAELESYGARPSSIRFFLLLHTTLNFCWVLTPHWWLGTGVLFALLGYVGSVAYNRFALATFMFFHTGVLATRISAIVLYFLQETSSMLYPQFSGISFAVMIMSLLMEIVMFVVLVSFWRSIPRGGMARYEHYMHRERERGAIV